jgi:hypothetical protein
MGTRDKQTPSASSDEGWIRLKLTQMQNDGVIINQNLIPSLENDDILQIRPIGSNEPPVCVQYRKNAGGEPRSKDRFIMVCSRVFQNRKDIFPQRGDVEVRRVEKESVRFYIRLN